MAREPAPGVFLAEKTADDALPHFGMMYTRPVKVKSADRPQIHKKFWFDVDPEMLSVAKGLRDVRLSDCDVADQCLRRQPCLEICVHRVSVPAFLDNAAWRALVF